MPNGATPLRLLTLTALCLVLLAGRVAWTGSRSLARGEQALAQHDRWAATLAFEQAAHSYLPGMPWHERGAEALVTLATEQERAGDLPGALLSWGALRGAALSRRHLLSRGPHPWQVQADGQLSRLLAAHPTTDLPGSSSDPERRLALERWLAATPAPAPGWSALAVGAFVVVLGAAWRFIFDGFSVEGAPQRAALPWLVTVLGGLALFALALLKA